MHLTLVDSQFQHPLTPVPVGLYVISISITSGPSV